MGPFLSYRAFITHIKALHRFPGIVSDALSLLVVFMVIGIQESFKKIL
jgi:hypothetical protein